MMHPIDCERSLLSTQIASLKALLEKPGLKLTAEGGGLEVSNSIQLDHARLIAVMDLEAIVARLETALAYRETDSSWVNPEIVQS